MKTKLCYTTHKNCNQSFCEQRNIGGSLLPSCSPEILIPIGDLQVIRCEHLDTHRLMRGSVIVAQHPNGFSCHALAERMAAGDRPMVLDQAEYIVRCGGFVNFEAL